MRTANWQQRESMRAEDVGLADIEALMAAAEAADDEIDFDLGEPWDKPFDPTDDDPE